MIDRQKGMIVIECDGCTEVIETGTLDFKEAVAMKKEQGWGSRKVGDEWLDLCPQMQKDTTMTAQRYQIVGTSFIEGAAEILKGLKNGEPLILIREPENKFDKNAVAVYFGDQRIGYIPRKQNLVLSKYLVALEAEIAADGKMPELRQSSIGGTFMLSQNSAFPKWS